MACRDDPAAAAALGDDDNRFAVFELRFGNDGRSEDLRSILGKLKVPKSEIAMKKLDTEQQLTSQRFCNLPKHGRIVEAERHAVAQLFGRVNEVSIFLQFVGYVSG